MSSDYLRKSCCLVVFSENGVTSSHFTDRLQSFLEKTGCTCNIYNLNIAVQRNEQHFQTEDGITLIVSKAFSAAFNDGFRKVIVLNASADIDFQSVEEAFYAMKLIEFVIGPTSDGWYLFGMNYFDEGIAAIAGEYIHTGKKVLIRRIGETRLALYKTPLLTENIVQPDI